MLTHPTDEHLLVPLLQRRDNLHLLKSCWTNIFTPAQTFDTHITQAVQLAQRLSSSQMVDSIYPVVPAILDDDQLHKDDHLQGDCEAHEDEHYSQEPDPEAEL